MATLEVVERKSTCVLDCPDTCSLTVTVEDGRVVKLDGSRDNEITAGYICGKVRHFTELVYGEDRVRYPAVRSGPKGSGQFRRATWDEALDIVVQRLQAIRHEHGGEAILPLCYGGSNGWLTHGPLDLRLFHRLGASRLARTLCAAATAAASTGLYGKMPGVAYDDYPQARLIIVWGCNPAVSGIHLVPYLRRAKENGAKLVVVDPRRTPLARQADLHLAVRPGTDLPVALSMINGLFESGRADLGFLSAHARNTEALRDRARAWSYGRAADVAGVAAADIERLTRLYADSTPAVVRCGWGIERNRNGGSAVAAVLALPAVAGKFGVRGGGFTMSNSFAWDMDPAAAACEPPPATRLINMNRVGEALAPGFAPPIRALFVYDCNPLATLPAQTKVRAGLAREDLFTIVHEQVLTDTARYADVLLPATTFLEHNELKRSYGAISLEWIDPVIEPVGEARPNYWLFAELCRRLGVARPGEPETPAELMRAIVATSRDGARIAADLERTGRAAPACGDRPVLFVDVFPATPDRKIDLCPAALDREAPAGLYGYTADPATGAFPLSLISPSTSDAISSTLYQRVRKQVPVGIHPADAAARGVADGDPVRVFNGAGEVRCVAEINDELRPGVAMLPKGLWAKHTANGQTANALAPDTLTDLGAGACFNDARVEIRPV
ncbi:MAG: molybdopterin-dependent oxidoreductase [Planctomycetia bacterium]|nr:molybdopterin-dependent oxidoreductase [Planctomycetia bacterium]